MEFRTMTGISRRSFLASITAAAGALYCHRSGLARPILHPSEPFEFLVIGDSLVWGQGLEEEQKFYRMTKSWLRDEIFMGQRPVSLNVLAHSGATIKLSDVEANALSEPEKDVGGRYHPEINVSFPTIEEQVKAARGDYEDARAVDLIMLSGGVPEVGVSNILNPFQSNNKLRADIKLYCYNHMSDLLQHTAEAFPTALIAVIGYYPIITRHTPMKRIVNDVLEIYNWPRWIKPLVNNPVERVFWRRYRGKMIERSRIWLEASSLEMKRAIDELNDREKQQRAVFVPTPFTEENGYGAKKTYLWKVAKKGRAADPMKAERKSECRPTLDELREKTKLKYRTRLCELASIGHPNVEGSAVIAAAIRETLRPVMASKVSNL